MEQSVIPRHNSSIATISFHTEVECRQVQVALDPSEDAPVFIANGVFYVRASDKSLHYFPMCNVRSVVVA